MSTPYLTVPELAELCDMEEQSVRNAISREQFDIPTFKFNGKRLAHKAVVDAFFEKQKEIGLSQLSKST